MNGSTRRLAAIAFTDMVGYSALAQRDEQQALKVLEKHNNAVRKALQLHQGREVKTIGDAFLLEFDSALEAVLWAVDMQNALAEQNKLARFDEMIVIRIGIHVGDVIHQSGDVLGDAVNIASRIVSLAEPGGICISEQVYAQVRNKVRQSLVRMPEQSMKNIAQPVELYRVTLGSGTDFSAKPVEKWNRIAVLPFENISPDPNDSYFADGLTEEIISAISEARGLRVVARTSVNRYKGTSKGVAEVGAELQVAYILEGSVRKASNKVRVNAQLIEVESQEHLWSNRYDRDLDDIFSIQSDIAKRVTEALRDALFSGQPRRTEKKETSSLTAYVAYLKGRALLHDRTEKAIKGAKEQFELAIHEDSGYAKAYAGLADVHVLLGDYLFAPVPLSLDNAKSYVNKALELDPNLSEARASLGNYLMFEYRFYEAEEEFRKAISLNPSYATAHQWYGICLHQLGREDESLGECLIAEELDPLSSALALSAAYRLIWKGRYDEALERVRKIKEIDPTSPLGTEALMAYHFSRREWDRAMTDLQEMVQQDPSDPYLDMDIAYIYAVTGRRDEALKIIEKLKEIPENARTKGNLIAFVYAGLGDLDECFRWLNYALENRELFLGFYRSYPLLQNVSRDPRFSELLKKANLPP